MTTEFAMTYEALQEAYYEQQEELILLKLENKKLKKKLKIVDDIMIGIEQIYYTKICEPSDGYNEEVLSDILNTILHEL